MEKSDSFERPAAYWLNRAKQAEVQSGDFRRAAVLERHALQAEPENEDACMSYVLTLQHMGCYESSNREAFAALARGSKRMGFYGVIGQNLLALGHRRAAFDAMDIYLASPPVRSTEWVDEISQRIDVGDLRNADRRWGLLRHCRYEGLRKRDITRRERPIGPSPAYLSAMRELGRARTYAGRGDAQRAQTYLRGALAQCPHDSTVLASAARVLGDLGLRAKACTLLTQAAMYARKPSEQQLVCQLSDQLQQPAIALSMLTRLQQKTPNRYPVCHNLAVALCRVGRVEEAMRYAHLCREIDPDDLQGQWMFECVTELKQGGEAQPCYWGVPTLDMMNGLLMPVLFSQLACTLIDDLQNDAGIRKRFLYMLDQPGHEGLIILESVVREGLSGEPLRRLLREVLLRRPEDTDVKRYALQKLAELQSEPFPVWDGDRFRMVDPTQAQEVQGK